MGPNRGQNGAKAGANPALKQTELPLGTETRAEQVLEALDGLTVCVEALKTGVMALVEAPAPPPPPPPPPPVRLAPLPMLVREDRPVHGFHLRLSEAEMELLRRLAQLTDSSQQRIARLAVREYCERMLKDVGTR